MLGEIKRYLNTGDLSRANQLVLRWLFSRQALEEAKQEPKNVLRLFLLIRGVEFSNRVATAQVDYVTHTITIGARFFVEHITSIDDLLFLLAHERTHRLLHYLVPGYIDELEKYPTTQMMRWADDIFVNLIAGSEWRSDFLYRFYPSKGWMSMVTLAPQDMPEEDSDEYRNLQAHIRALYKNIRASSINPRYMSQVCHEFHETCRSYCSLVHRKWLEEQMKKAAEAADNKQEPEEEAEEAASPANNDGDGEEESEESSEEGEESSEDTEEPEEGDTSGDSSSTSKSEEDSEPEDSDNESEDSDDSEADESADELEDGADDEDDAEGDENSEDDDSSDDADEDDDEEACSSDDADEDGEGEQEDGEGEDEQDDVTLEDMASPLNSGSGEGLDTVGREHYLEDELDDDPFAYEDIVQSPIDENEACVSEEHTYNKGQGYETIRVREPKPNSVAETIMKSLGSYDNVEAAKTAMQIALKSLIWARESSMGAEGRAWGGRPSRLDAALCGLGYVHPGGWQVSMQPPARCPYDLYFDISGSTSEYWSLVPWIGKIMREHVDGLFYFSTFVHDAKAEPNVLKTSGGTNFTSVLDYAAENRPQCKRLLIVTDNCDRIYDDAAELAKARYAEIVLIWLVDQYYSEAALQKMLANWQARKASLKPNWEPDDAWLRIAHRVFPCKPVVGHSAMDNLLI